MRALLDPLPLKKRKSSFRLRPPKPSFFAGAQPLPTNYVLPQYDPDSPPPIQSRPLDPTVKSVPYRYPDPTGSLTSKSQCELVARLYADHRAFVRRTVERHGVPIRDADDITQEVFTIALTRIHDFDAARAARPWLFVIAIQRAANYRRLARHRLEPLTSAPPPEPASEVADLESALLDSEERTLVRELIGRLSPKLRAILIMHDLDEKPMADIATELGIPVKTAHARLKLAREEVLRRGQALAASSSAVPLRNRDLLRVREDLLAYVQDPQAQEKALLQEQRKAPSSPITYFVFE